jgi:hypothetical protein
MTDALITDQEIAILCDVLEGWGANLNADKRMARQHGGYRQPRSGNCFLACAVHSSAISDGCFEVASSRAKLKTASELA